MLRLADQRRPVAWWLMRRFSERYRYMYEARGLADWQRIAMRRALLVPKAKLLYVINAKAASSSIRDSMYALGKAGAAEGERGYVIFPNPRWPDLVAALEDPGIYRFTVARHPVGRAVSAFTNLFIDRRNGFEWRHQLFMGRTGLKFGERSEANFDRFLDYVEEVQAESALFCDVHLRLQTHNVGARNIAYNRIGHYETLDADIAAVMAEAGGADFRADMLVPRNASSDRETPFTVTAAQIRRIETIYAEDYERMGY